MATRDDIEHYLIQIGYTYESVEAHMWVIRNTANIVVTLEPPLVLFRMKLMELPNKRREEFFKLLLEINASNMIHGAYGIEDNNVVLIDTLQAENLDYNEFQATLEALMLSSTQDYQKLKAFRD
jgi:Tir chaperone protein (CesT) family